MQETRKVGLIPGLGRSPGGGTWQPTPAFLLGESHGQRVGHGEDGKVHSEYKPQWEN